MRSEYYWNHEGKKFVFVWRKSSISIVFQGACANIPSCYEGLFKYQNISGSLWEHSFLPCANIQISEYFRALVGTFLPAVWEYSNMGIFPVPCGNPSCHAGIFKNRNTSGRVWKHSFHMLEYSKYRNISGHVWEHSFLTCGNIQISEYFRARRGTFLPNMRKYSNNGIFQGPCGKILSCRTVHVFTLSGKQYTVVMSHIPIGNTYYSLHLGFIIFGVG